EDGIRDFHATGVQTCALPISTPMPEPELSAIVIGADSIELLAGDTTLETLAFSNDPAGFVEVSVVVTAPALGDVDLRTTEGYRELGRAACRDSAQHLAGGARW